MNIAKVALKDCLQLRHEVLWPNLDISACKVAGDDAALHYGVIKDDEIVSCLSVFAIEKHQCQIRKFATKQRCQGEGYGTQLLRTVLKNLGTNNITLVFLDARISATNFYKRLGFQIEGEPFMKNNIEYIRMRIYLGKGEPD